VSTGRCGQQAKWLTACCFSLLHIIASCEKPLKRKRNASLHSATPDTETIFSKLLLRSTRNRHEVILIGKNSLSSLQDSEKTDRSNVF